MKVPDIPKEDNSLNDMTVYRKKQKRIRLIRNLIIFVVVITIGVLVYVFRNEIAEPFRGIANRFGSQSAEGQGFPVRLPGSSQYKLLPVGDNFALITDTYFYTYNSAGGQNIAVQHGYVNPAAVTNAKRTLIYDRGGHDFAVYSANAEIFKLSIDDEVIVSAYIGDNDKVAVVTSGGRYSNVVYVYDGSGKWLYTRKFIDENVMQADFSDDEKFMFLTLVRSDNGNIITDLCKYDISSEDNELWKYSISDGLPYGLDVNGDIVTVIGDNAAYSINSDDGKQNGSYAYNGELLDFDIGNNANVLVLDYYTGEGKTVTVLDKCCAETKTVSDYDLISEILISDGEICILSGRDMFRTDLELSVQKETRLEQDFSSFIKVGSMYLMLGYDTISQADL
ncbi:MAG: hypothetical protein J1E39_01060 [Eubacterium sp.]|nr:hypothetical protein [Eubacterium sp.]